MTRLVLAALALGGLAMAGTAQAQSWATRAACTVTEAQIDPGVLPDDVLSDYRQQADAIPDSTGRFWQVTGPDGAVSHLWGTYHSTDPLILDLPDAVLDTIDAARVIAPEVNLSYASRAEIEKSQARDGWTKSVNPAPHSFSPDTTGLAAPIIEQIRDRAEAVGWGREAPDYLTLDGLASLLLGDPCDDFAGGVSLIQDDRIAMLGRIAGAQVLGLEPRTALLDHLNDPANRAIALSMLHVYGAYLLPPDPKARATHFGLYTRGEIGVMMAWDRAFLRAHLGKGADRHLARTEEYLLEERNRRFLARSLPEFQKGDVFMAVGSFHLPLETGMIALLRNAGFAVTRIALPGEAP